MHKVSYVVFCIGDHSPVGEAMVLPVGGVDVAVDFYAFGGIAFS